MADRTEPQPFTIEVGEQQLGDLRRRLAATRWPDRETVEDWSQGVPLDVLRDLAAYWAEGYDWRRFEARMRTLPQQTCEVDGLRLHYLHVRSARPGAVPLVMTHGWPGAFVEFLDVIEPLTTPPDGQPAFHLVIPSLPGYGFSERPTGTGWGIERIARAWVSLMDVLGYERFAATGGDWGTSISTVLGLQAPERVLGLHLTPPLVAPDPATSDDLTPAEREALQALEAAGEGSAYSAVHRTRPQTLAYGLADSPVALAAWIFEKLAAWTDGDVLEVLGRDRVLDLITLYWLTATGPSSTRLYWESIETVEGWFTRGTTDTVTVPTGAAVFRDLPRPSRRWAARRFTDLRYWSEPERGGHFAAFEQPEVYVRELRASFAAILAGPPGS